MSLKSKWMGKGARLMPVTMIAAMLMAACGGNTASPTTAPTTAAQPTVMATAMQPTAVMVPTAMATVMATAMPGGTGTPGGSMTSLTVQMKAQNGSGQDGTAILGVSATGDTVMITLSNGTSEPQPAHIHKGTCANLDPNPLVPLNPVVNGKSDTTITGGVTTMEAGQSYAINVHKSAAEVSVYVSCGDITDSSMTGNETPGAMMTPGTSGMMDMSVQMKEQNGSGENGTATIKKSDSGMVVALDLQNGTTEPQPAHIHKGTCANLGDVAVPLTNVVSGKSETTVPASFTMEAGQSYAINVHKSAAEVSVYVSCGDITESSMMTGTPGVSDESMNVTLNAQNTSGQSGTAVITKKSDADVMVSLNLGNGTTEPQPAHIHKGTCANLDPNPAFPLTNVVDGKSESEVMVSMSELEKGGYAINIHKSAAEASVYVACGDITPAMMGDTTPVATP